MKLLFFLPISACLCMAFRANCQSNSSNKTEPLASIDTTLQQSILLQDEVVVVGLRYQNNAFNRNESIALLNRQKLEQLATMSTPDALANVNGVWMQKTNHGGGSPFIRGLTGYQTLLMIDGIRLNNSTFRSGPNQYANTIDPFTLERVEVTHGNGSVAYGTDAIGGTALLLTKDPTFIQGKAKFAGNVYSKWVSADMEKTLRAEAAFQSEKVAFIGGVTTRSLGDIKAGGDLGTLDNTGYNELDWDAKLKFKLSDKYLLTLAHQHVKQNEVPLFHKLVTGEYSTYQFDPQQRDLTYARLKAFYDTPLLSEVTYTVSWQRSLEIRKKQKSGSSIFTREEDEVNTLGATVEVISRLKPNWTISSGIEFYHDEVNSFATAFDEDNTTSTSQRGLYPAESSADNFAVYSMHDYEWGKFNFTGGVRWNYFKLALADEAFGDTEITPSALVGNLGVSFQLSKAHRLISSLSSAFRAPNINDVASFGIADFRYEVPNYDLAPEKSLNWEVGYKLSTPKLSGSIFYFQNRLTDLITNTQGSFNGQTEIEGYQVYFRSNSNKAIIKGVEAQMQWAIHKKWLIQASIAYTRGDDLSKNEPMRRIPPLFGKWNVTYNASDSWYVKADFLFAGKQDRLSSGDQSDNRIAEGGTPSWQVFNISTGVNISLLNIQAGIQNIFNEAYRTHGSGIDGLGRNLWIALTAKF